MLDLFKVILHLCIKGCQCISCCKHYGNKGKDRKLYTRIARKKLKTLRGDYEEEV